MKLILIDRDLLQSTIACNTDASEQDARGIISQTLYKQRKQHSGECETDEHSRAVCEALYAENCDDVIGLCEALRAVLSLAGESKEIRRVIEGAISEYGEGQDMTQDTHKTLFDKCFTGGDLDLRGATCCRCSFGLGMKLLVDSKTQFVSCWLDICELVLPDGVDEVTVVAQSSTLNNVFVEDGKKVKFKAFGTAEAPMVIRT